MNAFEIPNRFLEGCLKKSVFLIACLLIGAPGAYCQKSPAKSDAVQQDSISGKVVETMNAANYTYFQVDTGRKKLWVAAPQFTVKTGDAVVVGDAMPMAGYHSKALNRDFDVVYFTGNVMLNGKAVGGGRQASELPKNHPSISGSGAKPAVTFAGIKKADGGKDIAEIYAGRPGLKGKEVKVRGKVVKYNGEVMGKNWLHVQDGTGGPGSNDLTVTTASKTKVGDIVLVVGKVSLDRDFGGGYQYSLIIEDAKVTVE